MWRILIVTCALAACSPTPAAKEAAPPPSEAAPIAAADNVIAPAAPWTCADGQVFTVTILGDPGRAQIAFGDGTRMILYQSPAASGSLYENTTHSFHAKGNEALLTSGDKTTTCRGPSEPE